MKMNYSYSSDYALATQSAVVTVQLIKIVAACNIITHVPGTCTEDRQTANNMLPLGLGLTVHAMFQHISC